MVFRRLRIVVALAIFWCAASPAGRFLPECVGNFLVDPMRSLSLLPLAGPYFGMFVHDPELGEEEFFEWEDRVAQQAAEAVDGIQARYAPAGGPPRRALHAETIAFLKGTFNVRSGFAIPLMVRDGLFRASGSFDLVARFSSAAPAAHGQVDPDFFGLAFRVSGSSNGGWVQDFLTTNKPRATAEPKAFRDFLRAQAAGQMWRFALRHPLSTLLLLDQRHYVESLAEETYWGAGPIRIGPERDSFAPVVKFFVRPKDPEPFLPREPNTPERLRREIQARLHARGHLAWEFCVQVQLASRATPVLPARWIWDERRAPPKVLAELTFEDQTVASPERLAEGDAIEFNPVTNRLPEHRVVGPLMRMRAAPYTRSQNNRRAPP